MKHPWTVYDDSGRPEPGGRAVLVIAALIIFGLLTIYNYYQDYRRDIETERIRTTVTRINNALWVETETAP